MEALCIHSAYKHKTFRDDRYFYSSTGNNYPKHSQSERSKSFSTDLKSDSQEVQENVNTDVEPAHYQCQGSCSTIQKTFLSPEELELHHEYFHSEEQQTEQL